MLKYKKFDNLIIYWKTINNKNILDSCVFLTTLAPKILINKNYTATEDKIYVNNLNYNFIKLSSNLSFNIQERILKPVETGYSYGIQDPILQLISFSEDYETNLTDEEKKDLKVIKKIAKVSFNQNEKIKIFLHKVFPQEYI